jgi:ABC-type cobalamin transport system permease subunit
MVGLSDCWSHILRPGEARPELFPAPWAIFLCARICRLPFFAVEFKIGVLTALLGAPFFIYLAFKAKTQLA